MDKCPEEKTRQSIGRRSFLKSTSAAAAAVGFVPSIGSAAPSAQVLGNFESGVDGWQSNGGVTLSRVSAADRPAVVENGDYALAVTAGGDAYPVIENKRRLEGNSFVETPYLLGRISTSPVASHEKLTVVLRYHHQDTPARGNQNGRRNAGGGKPVLVEETTVEVPLGVRSGLSWDLSDLSDAKLETPKRLEIGWYLGDSPPQRGPRGRQPHGPAPGEVYLDAIRMTDRRDSLDRAALVNHMDNLILEHGGDYRYESREFFESGERGAFVFSDGATVPVVWEALDSGKERYTVDGETYRLGGDER